MTKQLEKYLRTRAVTAPWRIEGAARRNYKAAVIIPVLSEYNSLPKTIESLATNPVEYLRQTLILIIVNNRADISADQFEDNRQTLAWLRTGLHPDLNLAWVDASSPGLELPGNEGVGLARKIGFDLALSQLDRSAKSLLISLDADALVDQNYLAAICAHFAASQTGGATVPFRHQTAGDPCHEAAIRQYELYLRSYLFGLQQAGSPYAYHTIGSTFACRAEAYVAAGGMNRRPAAEDFYFLQQLAKTSGVEMLSGTVVRPSSRFSNRVPFGTGRAVQGQVENNQQLFRFSSAAAFSVLRQWLDLAAGMQEQPAGKVLAVAKQLSPLLWQFLEELNFSEAWVRLQANYPRVSRRRHAFHCWFDGLRTRQLLTRLDFETTQPVDKLLADLLEWGGYPDIKRQSEQLRLLERLQHAEIN